jgi:HSP20 family molecular chaperone IbpA
MINYKLDKFLTNEMKYFDTLTTTSTTLKDYFEKSYPYKDFKKQLQFAGFDREELSVSYENDYLTIDGKSVMLDSVYSKRYYLPSKNYDVNNISVKFEKCILTVECKLKEEKESKVLKIVIK